MSRNALEALSFFMLLNITMFILLSLLSSTVSASSGLKVIAHVNDSGSVCVSSMSEDLGCQSVYGGVNEIVFEFNPGVVEVGEEVEVCFNDNCQYAVNGPEKLPINVYITDLQTNEAETDTDNTENGTTPDNFGNENAQTETSDDNGQYVFIIGIPIFLGLLIWIWLRGRKRFERRSFSTYVRKQILIKQGYKCAICKKSAGVWDFDHIDGDRSNNDISNCQALCPNCHAKKTRGLIKYEEHRTPFKKIDYPLIELSSVCKIIDNLHSTPKYDGHQFLCIRSQDVSWGKINYDVALATSENEFKERIRRGEPRLGDIAYVREGDIGRCAIVDGSHRFSLGQRVMIIRPNLNDIDSKFLFYQLWSPTVLEEQVHASKTGMTARHVNIAFFKSVKIKIPPMEEQLRIVSYFDSLFSRVERLHRAISDNLPPFDQLEDSILDRIFTGTAK